MFKKNFVTRFFALEERQSTVRTEILSGVTTFLTMAYILAVNPSILSQCGMDGPSVFVATALSAALGTACMALLANMPLALAPSMGQNAFFAYTIVLGMGHSWQFALTAVFLVGLLFLLLSLFRVREALLHCMPSSLKEAMTAGVGLFIAFIGLQSAGIVVGDAATFVKIGNMHSPRVWVGVFTLLCTALLLCYKVRGALLLGIVAGTVLGIPLGVTPLQSFDLQQFLSVPSVAPTFWQFEWKHVFTLDMFMVVVIFLFSNLFDTMATLLGVAKHANLLDTKGHLPKTQQAFVADSLATTAGAIFGTSPLTTYVESLSGVAEGGRSGLMTLTVSALFLLSLLAAPVFLLIPQEATAAILILVGLFMTASVVEVDFSNPFLGIPSFCILVLMPLTYSIAAGIMVGSIVYVLLHVCAGRWREVSPFLYILCVIFVFYFALA